MGVQRAKAGKGAGFGEGGLVSAACKFFKISCLCNRRVWKIDMSFLGNNLYDLN